MGRGKLLAPTPQAPPSLHQRCGAGRAEGASGWDCWRCCGSCYDGTSSGGLSVSRRHCCEQVPGPPLPPLASPPSTPPKDPISPWSPAYLVETLGAGL